jgi:hypothetical protein
MLFRSLIREYAEPDLTTPSGRALVEECYGSLRRQVPIVYLLGLVNMSAMELATTGSLSPGITCRASLLPAACSD